MRFLFINGSPNRKGNMNCFEKLYGFEYAGMATNRSEAEKLGEGI